MSINRKIRRRKERELVTELSKRYSGLERKLVRHLIKTAGAFKRLQLNKGRASQCTKGVFR